MLICSKCKGIIEELGELPSYDNPCICNKSEKEIISKYMSKLGKIGGSAKSEKKTKAVKENGKKGGRPKGKKRKGDKDGSI